VGNGDDEEPPRDDRRVTRRALTNVLIKPAGPDCNLGCTYCFYLDKAALFPPGAHRMTEPVLAATLRQMLAQDAAAVSFSWQGGEPTLMGLGFFQKAVDYEMAFGRGQTVSNALQTNGIRLDATWARFLAKYRFLVGLSLDGPAHVHDKYRVNHGGKGTWRKVDDRARMLLDAGVAVNALTVVNDYSAQHADEIYAYLRDAGLAYMQFIPCYEPGKPYTVTPEAYGEFLCRVFDLWRADFENGVPTTSVRWFDSLLNLYAGRAPNDCTLLEECGTYLVVEHDGGVYSCDFYVQEGGRLGSVSDNDLAALYAGVRQREFGAAKARLAPACQACEWLTVCRGGCPKDRAEVSYFCAAYKRFFAHAGGELRRLAAG
jgi:uncharacterized protein